MRVIYIAGTSHSGSTLLDMMLNAHPDIVSVGEVLKLNRIKRPKHGKPRAACACGAESLHRCKFWARVSEQIQTVEGKTFADLDLMKHPRSNDGTDSNLILFRAIAKVTGKEFIVDSSKLPSRLKHLMSLDELNVYPVHLIRSPRGQIASVIAQKGLLKSIVSYEIVNAQIRSAVSSVPHQVVSYEELVTRPQPTLQSLLDKFDLKFHCSQLRWAEQEKHNFAGNHIRKSKTSELVLDERWRERLNAMQLSLIELGTLLSRTNRAQVE